MVSLMREGYGVKDWETRLSTSATMGREPSRKTVTALPETSSFLFRLVMKYSDGLSMERRPFSVMAKKPISPVLPKRFFVANSPRSSSAPSPSNTRTVSTRCSNARRPAISSFLFICPIISAARCLRLSFAHCTNAEAHSMVWVGLPALAG